MPVPPNERWSLAAALDATDLFLVSEMGIAFEEDGIMIRTGNGWHFRGWDEKPEPAQVSPFDNPTKLDDFGPNSQAGRDFMAALAAHNAAHAAASAGDAPDGLNS